MSCSAVTLLPLYQPKATPLEHISIQQCFRVLDRHPIFFVVPQSLSLTDYKAYQPTDIIRMPDEYFKSIKGYNRMLLSPSFYRRFRRFEYVLIYQTDAFVFRDELEKWCAKGYDYIGGVWFKDFFAPPEIENLHLGGNGGLSLRNVAALIRLLESRQRLPAHIDFPPIYQQRSLYRKFYERFIEQKTIRNYYKRLSSQEDEALILTAEFLGKPLKVAPWEVAIQFAFDRFPWFLYALNQQKLPFGCHAWNKNEWPYGQNLNFWRPFIESACGHPIP